MLKLALSSSRGARRAALAVALAVATAVALPTPTFATAKGVDFAAAYCRASPAQRAADLPRPERQVTVNPGEASRSSPGFIALTFYTVEPGQSLANRIAREITVMGSHFIQEDSPDEIGRVIVEWYLELS